MKPIQYSEIEGRNPRFYAFAAILVLFVLAGLGSAYYMEHYGHWVTGMSNQVVWGTPHVFAIFLIVAASGALNVASIGTVFGKTLYKPLGRLSGLLAIAMLVGGLCVLVLDLGRADRLTGYARPGEVEGHHRVLETESRLAAQQGRLSCRLLRLDRTV